MGARSTGGGQCPIQELPQVKGGQEGGVQEQADGRREKDGQPETQRAEMGTDEGVSEVPQEE